MQHYILWYKLNFCNRYIIWCSSEDGNDFVWSTNGTIPYFSSKLELIQFANQKGIQLEKEIPIVHNLDIIKIWLNNQKKEIDCQTFLAAWNFFGDISASNNRDKKLFKLFTQQYNAEYHKLFAGNNLKAVSKYNRKYFPAWNRLEKEHIKKIMQKGFGLMKYRFKKYV